MYIEINIYKFINIYTYIYLYSPLFVFSKIHAFVVFGLFNCNDIRYLIAKTWGQLTNSHLQNIYSKAMFFINIFSLEGSYFN